MITTSIYEKTIEHQFDSFCKTVIRNFARDIYDENKRRNERLVSLEALTMAELSQLSIFDDYDSNYIIMASYDYDIRIEDVLIAQAIGQLTKRKLTIKYRYRKNTHFCHEVKVCIFLFLSKIPPLSTVIGVSKVN